MRKNSTLSCTVLHYFCRYSDPRFGSFTVGTYSKLPGEGWGITSLPHHITCGYPLHYPLHCGGIVAKFKKTNSNYHNFTSNHMVFGIKCMVNLTLNPNLKSKYQKSDIFCPFYFSTPYSYLCKISSKVKIIMMIKINSNFHNFTSNHVVLGIKPMVNLTLNPNLKSK